MVAAFAEEHAEEFRTSLQQPALLESGTHPPCFYAAYLEFLQRQETSRMQQHSGLLFGYDFEGAHIRLFGPESAGFYSYLQLG